MYCHEFEESVKKSADELVYHLGLMARAMAEALTETRRLTWRERLRPLWRIFQWLHDALYGEATFFCGERLNLHRGAELEDWVAGLFGMEE